MPMKTRHFVVVILIGVIFTLKNSDILKNIKRKVEKWVIKEF